MDKQQLLATLQELRGDLSGADDVDQETLQRLDGLITQLETHTNPDDQAVADAVEPSTGGLRELLRKFEADHPQLSASIGRVADALAAMGF